MNSQVVSDIVTAIGVEPGSDDLSRLRYSRICILADADHDGLHIASLITVLFFQHFRPLVEAGVIYVVLPPLYRLDKGKEVRYAHDEDSRQEIIKEFTKGKASEKRIQVTRFKGLGEMNTGQLRETVMLLKHRHALRLQYSFEDFERSQEVLDKLMSKKRAADRKLWLSEKGDASQAIV